MIYNVILQSSKLSERPPADEGQVVGPPGRLERLIRADLVRGKVGYIDSAISISI